MPTSFSHIDLCLVTFTLPLLRLLQNCYCYFCHRYRYFHTTLLLNTLLQILSFPGVVELTTQLLILEDILWLPLCRINKFGLNTLPLKTVVIPYTCGLSQHSNGSHYYHCYASCFDAIAMSRFLPLVCQASQIAMSASNIFHPS